MARPVGPNSGYIVKLHKMGKYQYASTERTKEAKNGKTIPIHIHWGRVDGQLRFYPNERFLYETLSERAKLIFPEDWDLSLIKRLLPGDKELDNGEKSVQESTVAGQAETASMLSLAECVTTNQNRFYGATWLLGMIAERTGVRRDLLATFGENTIVVDGILTIAMFLFTTNYNLSRLAAWQALEKYPAPNTMSSSAITLLQQSITEAHRIEFLKYRASRVAYGEILSVDSTTKTSFHGKLIDVAWGKNKEGLNLPDTMEVMAYSLDSHMPVYYRTLPGNFPDARSIELICSDMKEAGFGQFIMVTDRAYSSTKNLEMFIRIGQKSIMCQKVSTGMTLKKIKELGTFDFIPDGFQYSDEHDLYLRQFDMPYSIRLNDGSVIAADRLKLNLYFDPVYRSKCLKKLDISLMPTEEELASLVDRGLTLKSLDEVEAFEEEYDIYDIKWSVQKVPIDPNKHMNDPIKRGRKRKYDDVYVLKKYTRNSARFISKRQTSGFRAILTLGVDMTAEEALTHYSLRAEQENDFEQWKSQMQCDRERNSSEGGKAGAMFIQFIAKILSSQLKHMWKSSNELRKTFGSSLSILDEMRKIRLVEYADQQKKLVTPFVGKQLLICKEMGFDIPTGCSKGYRSMKVDEI